MDFLTSKRFVTTSLVVLALLNVTLLGVVMWQNFFSRQFRSVEVREYYARSDSPAAGKVFSPEQMARFRKLRREHFRNSLPEIRQMLQLKQELIDEAVKPGPDMAKIARIADMIGTRQAKLDKDLAMHFNDLSRLCSPSQRDSLKAFLGKVYTRRYEHRVQWIREIRPAGLPSERPAP
jgi:uncharacterized membrane protein